MDPSENQLSNVGSEKLVKIDIPLAQDEKPSPKEGVRVSINSNKQEFENVDRLTLTEDVFGEYWDCSGVKHNIKRFTWTNINKIQVQVINYGARITSMKFPDRKGEIEDIVLGFDDLEGYIFYKKFYFGATIGRMTNLVRNSTFQIDKKQYWINENHQRHHINGGKKGFDQVVWNTYVDGKKVIMTHVSPDSTEGYPGDLLVRITFELSEINEFKINMEALTTAPTIINLSNFTYFNLAGHQKGADEIYKHILTMNCNCFTPEIDGLATGEILNVINTQYDFQIPKVLGKVMGMTPKSGFNQNLCVNRGLDQEECFVARVLHPPSGRLLEIYSNQLGVNFSTANEFGYGRILSLQKIVPLHNKSTRNDQKDLDPLLKLFNQIYGSLMDSLKIDAEQNYVDLRDLILDIDSLKSGLRTPYNSPSPSIQAEIDTDMPIVLSPLQKNYLEQMLKILYSQDTDQSGLLMKRNIEKVLKNSVFIKAKSFGEPEFIDKLPKEFTEKKKESNPIIKENIIPDYYKSTDQIVGKERKVYRMHGAISLQPQNYPCCANFSHFPSCILYPGQSYKHTLTYKFWIRAGSPNKWIRRNMKENNKKYSKM